MDKASLKMTEDTSNQERSEEHDIDEFSSIMMVKKKNKDINFIDELKLHQVEFETQYQALKLVEDKLIDSEIRYRRLFESAKDGILILDAISGQIVDVNPFLTENLEYSYEELLGKELWEIGTFKKIAASKDAFIELQKEEYIRFEDMPLKTKSGKSINVEFVSNVYLVNNEKVIQCNIRDITDRKKTEQDLRESESRLRELNATKDKFFSIIAHDLKSPFTSIIGLSELLAEQVSKNDYDGIDEYANMIQTSSWHAMDLLTNLMEWSRSQTGRIVFNPQNINMAELIEETLALLQESANQKNIAISKNFPAGFTAFADKSMINTILRNLISNAIKYTNTDGKIDISAIHGEKELILSVSDDGVGIKENDLGKLFLIEANRSTRGTRDEEGTGLGLILCKEFISKHGGKIWAESVSGQGSRFAFTIPV